jgi:ATP-dependent RNA helicase DeaD
MSPDDLEHQLGPELARAFAEKGYTELTAVQQAVLDPRLDGRDMRITSQTGSGKTIAVGIAIRGDVSRPPGAGGKEVRGVARPRALVVAPTRELARQVEEELGWLYANAGARVASATGGASYRDELRALARNPAIVVGTPGRLLDHLTRKSVDVSDVSTIVLDEADRMLDLGFREELEAIIATLPEPHRTHLVSATFPRDVQALANRVQTDAAHVEGTRLGTANTDIDHVIHLVEPRAKLDAIVNLLLASPGAQTLIFARTRADVADIADELSEAGFRIGALSGDLEQAARNRALGSFKRGDLQALVATDVAARGIDVSDIARVIHVDVPTNPDAYTHRSGRTGRAGRRGTSSLLVPPAALSQATRILRRAGVTYSTQPIPTAEEIREAADARLAAEILAGDAAPDARAVTLAERLLEAAPPAEVVARLVARVRTTSGVEPRAVRAPKARSAPSAERRPSHSARPGSDEGWVRFRVTFGQEHGADPGRVLAMICRRGNVAGSAVGAIRVEPRFSTVDVAASAAEAFAASAAKPDPRDARVRIEPYREPERRSGPSATREAHPQRREAHPPRREPHPPRREVHPPRREAHPPRRDAHPPRPHRAAPHKEKEARPGPQRPPTRASRGKR